MAVPRNLHATCNAVGAILHKIYSPSCITTADEVRDAKLRISVDCCPRPYISSPIYFLCARYILLFGSGKCPYLIALETADTNLADMLIVEIHGGCSDIDEQRRYGID